jgi:hypothetical protein
MSGEGETKLDLSICDRFQFEIAAVFFLNKKGNADFRT